MATPNKNGGSLSGQTRALFVESAVRLLPGLSRAIQERLSALVDQPVAAREMQERRDGWLAFQRAGSNWIKGTAEAWTAARQLTPPPSASKLSLTGAFELMGDEVMDDEIATSRLALRLLDLVSWELNDVRLRIQRLDAIAELHKEDIFRPEVLARHMLQQWSRAGLPRPLWVSVQDVIQKTLAEQMLSVYHAANEFLVRSGVMAEIDLRPMVKRTPSNSRNDPPADLVRSDGAVVGAQDPGRGHDVAPSGRPDQSAPATSARPAAGSGAALHSPPPNQRVGEETRMQTGVSPLARARMRAQGVMGQLKRMLADHVPGFEETSPTPPTPALVRALDAQHSQNVSVEHIATGAAYGSAEVAEAVAVVRARSAALKQAASSASEKATIEIVALMFQSILAEERIPAAIRVWFARLQIPVLRVALSETEFFESLQHPARRLIDRMGSCALGFNATISGGALELEVRRVVQVIEQYPETGRRVFQIAYDEFEKFLAKFLSERRSTLRVVTVAQQVEQKETMAIQYTIELRSMLNDMPVREAIREFLFKVWAEVLAISAVKNGPQHPETVTLKRTAADLVWAASAKPNREDRARVIAALPALLQLLRSGMTMLGLSVAEQDRHLKAISDTLADAFMSKTEGISGERIEQMAKRLAHLEDYLSDDDVGDLPLDPESLITMIGLDAADVKIITDGGSTPTEAVRAWVTELQLGSWFNLDHSGAVTQVQFAWCSERKQLHLFASADALHFLIQAKRVAAYLQAGLLVPTEEETLTVRATRDALAKLNANPERLLS
ncbi:MAG: DUF1631 domain-containing protein [Polaromonas sp.]|nr:DUF1631 domain-containing protein [Polaromonas sp.]